MNTIWKAEPTMVLSVISAGLALGMGFGLHITTQQMGLVMAFAAAVLGLINRSQVTSPASLQALTPGTLATAQDAAQPVKDTIKKLPVVLLACGLVTWFACASLPLKQKAVIGLQASESALEGAHNIERSLCFVSPSTEQGGHCTSPQAAIVKLTDQKHQQIAGIFAKAFADEIKAAILLKAWKAGDPAPNDVSTYDADLQQILTIAKTLDPAAASLVTQIQSAVDSSAAVLIALGVK